VARFVAELLHSLLVAWLLLTLPVVCHHETAVSLIGAITTGHVHATPASPEPAGELMAGPQDGAAAGVVRWAPSPAPGRGHLWGTGEAGTATLTLLAAHWEVALVSSTDLPLPLASSWPAPDPPSEIPRSLSLTPPTPPPRTLPL
jgi:hypothetical protein